MKKFLFSLFLSSMLFSSSVYADVSECAYTGDSIRIYLTSSSDILLMVNEIEDGKNIFDNDSVIYINNFKAKLTDDNTYCIDLPVGNWYDKNKNYAVRINGKEELYIFGDINLDGKVTKEDAREILSSAFDETSNEKNFISYTVADVDFDGCINASDAAIVINNSINK